MSYIISESWDKVLSEYIKSDDFKELGKFIQSRRKAFNVRVYPKNADIFRAFKETPVDEVKAVIVGFEPAKEYQSNGLAFGSNGDGHIPLGTCLMYKEYEDTIMRGLDLMFDYSMLPFAKKGVLMLNLALTVDNRQSHVKEWMAFTKLVLSHLDGKVPFFLIGDKTFGCVNMLLNSNVTLTDKIEGSKLFEQIEIQTDIKFKL